MAVEVRAQARGVIAHGGAGRSSAFPPLPPPIGAAKCDVPGRSPPIMRRAGHIAAARTAPATVFRLDGRIRMDALKWHIIDFFQALAAGLLVGGIYGLMCVGLGMIFGVMRVINFAQGDFMMLGMYATYYLVTGFGILAFLGPYVGPFVGAALAGPIVFGVRLALHRYLISRVSGARVASAEGEGHYAQIIMTLGIALFSQNGGLIVFGSVPLSVRTPLSSSAWEIGRDMSSSIRRAPSPSSRRDHGAALTCS